MNYYRIYFLLIFSMFIYRDVLGQKVSISETKEYLKILVNENLLGKETIYGGQKKINIEVSDLEISKKYLWENSKQVINSDYHNLGINYNHLSFDFNQIGDAFLKNNAIRVKCLDGTKNCFFMEEEAIKRYLSSGFNDNPKLINHSDYLNIFYLRKNQIDDQNKILVAFNYLLRELKDSLQSLDDPIYEAIRNEKPPKRIFIPLKKKNGIYTLKVNMAGIIQEVILDSGASYISVSSAFLRKLQIRGVIREENFISPALFRIADGRIVEAQRFVMPYVSIDGHRIQNVTCSVNPTENIVLLGKSFLDHFRSWGTNNNSQQLILEY